MIVTKRLKEIKKEFYRFVPFITTGLITMISVLSVVLRPDFINEKGETVSYIVNSSVKYFGYGLILNVILILINENIWKYTFSIQLLLSIFGLTNIFNRTFEIGFGVIEFEIVSSIMLIFHLILNSDIIRNNSVGDKNIEEIKKERQKDSEDLIKKYERNFQSKTDLELTEISNSDSYTNEAKQAAKILLEKR